MFYEKPRIKNALSCNITLKQIDRDVQQWNKYWQDQGGQEEISIEKGVAHKSILLIRVKLEDLTIFADECCLLFVGVINFYLKLPLLEII